MIKIYRDVFKFGCAHKKEAMTVCRSDCHGKFKTVEIGTNVSSVEAFHTYLLNFGYKSNNHGPNYFWQAVCFWVRLRTEKECFSDSVLWKTGSGARIN